MKDHGLKAQKSWRIIDIVQWAEDYFKSRKFKSPRSEIEWLLRDILQCSRVDIYLRFDELLTEAQLKKLRQSIRRRINNEPLQYITGHAEFYGLNFAVNPDVLIPRPETERLVDTAIHSLRPQDRSLILDVGTGSGCIAIVLAKEFPGSRIIAMDVTEEALDVARKNAISNHVNNIEFVLQDFLGDFTLEDRVDLLVSNPPYVTKEELTETMVDVRDFEPHIALTDGADGLTFYRRFAENAPQLIKKDGRLIVEVGIDSHPQKVMEIFNRPYLADIEIIQDYNGDDRVIQVRYTGEGQ